ncbi:MAG: hypothetical protein KGV44_12820 [Flavobacteriaceae bacterium]|nr:hypothetical protein [Flavobacteriaceae bacterium]
MSNKNHFGYTKFYSPDVLQPISEKLLYSSFDFSNPNFVAELFEADFSQFISYIIKYKFNELNKKIPSLSIGEEFRHICEIYGHTLSFLHFFKKYLELHFDTEMLDRFLFYVDNAIRTVEYDFKTPLKTVEGVSFEYGNGTLTYSDFLKRTSNSSDYFELKGLPLDTVVPTYLYGYASYSEGGGSFEVAPNSEETEIKKNDTMKNINENPNVEGGGDVNASQPNGMPISDAVVGNPNGLTYAEAGLSAPDGQAGVLDLIIEGGEILVDLIKKGGKKAERAWDKMNTQQKYSSMITAYQMAVNELDGRFKEKNANYYTEKSKLLNYFYTYMVASRANASEPSSIESNDQFISFMQSELSKFNSSIPQNLTYTTVSTDFSPIRKQGLLFITWNSEQLNILRQGHYSQFSEKQNTSTNTSNSSSISDGKGGNFWLMLSIPVLLVYFLFIKDKKKK